MPEKGRFPAVLQPVIPILEAGARTGVSTTDIRAGIGIGNDGDPMFMLQSSKQHAVAVLPFNTTQITSPENGTQDHDVRVNLAHTLGRNSGQENAVCVTGDITHTLTSEGFDASEDSTGRGQPIIAFSCKDYGNDATPDLNPTMRAMNHSGSHANAGGQLAIQSEMAVRRLMPVECESLQGFPSNWTLVPVGKGMAADGPRYKQLGNSWAVPCVTWIGKRLAAHLADLDNRVVEPVSMSDDALHLWLCTA